MINDKLRHRMVEILNQDRANMNIDLAARIFQSGCMFDSIKSIYSNLTDDPLPTDFLWEFNSSFPESSVSLERLNLINKIITSNLGLGINRVETFRGYHWISDAIETTLPSDKSDIEMSTLLLKVRRSESLMSLIVLLAADNFPLHAVGLASGGDIELAYSEIESYLSGRYKDENWKIAAIIHIEELGAESKNKKSTI